MPELSITGTLVNYYVLCRRKAWLAVHGLWMEQESEAVALGRLLDETTYADELQHVNVEVEGHEGSGWPDASTGPSCATAYSTRRNGVPPASKRTAGSFASTCGCSSSGV